MAGLSSNSRLAAGNQPPTPTMTSARTLDAAAAMDDGRLEPPTSTEDYLPLQSLRVGTPVEGDGFTVCLWLYLSSSTPAPATIVGQVNVCFGLERVQDLIFLFFFFSGVFWMVDLVLECVNFFKLCLCFFVGWGLKICTGDGGDREAPFLRLNGDKSLSVFPVLSVHEEPERIMDSSSNPGSDSLCAIAGAEFSLGKWVHIGCEVKYSPYFRFVLIAN